MKEAIKKLAALHSDKLRAGLEVHAILAGLATDAERQAAIAAVEGLLEGRPQRKTKAKKEKSAKA